jgi:hypothetical protein
VAGGRATYESDDAPAPGIEPLLEIVGEAATQLSHSPRKAGPAARPGVPVPSAFLGPSATGDSPLPRQQGRRNHWRFHPTHGEALDCACGLHLNDITGWLVAQTSDEDHLSEYPSSREKDAPPGDDLVQQPGRSGDVVTGEVVPEWSGLGGDPVVDSPGQLAPGGCEPPVAEEAAVG